MKRILDFIKNLFIFAYILVILFITVCLLAYNDYKLTVFGDKTLVPVIDDDLEPSYTVGDLLIIKRNKIEDVKVGDVIFFYRTRSGETTINFAPVTDLEELTATETTITVEGDFRLSSTNFIGKTESASVIPNVGRILHTLESKWGFLFLGVFPSFLVFIYTLYSVVLEFYDVRANKNKKKNKKKKTSTDTENEKVVTSEETTEKDESKSSENVAASEVVITDENIEKKNEEVPVIEEKEEEKNIDSKKEETPVEEKKEEDNSGKIEAESIKNIFSSVLSNAEDDETKKDENEVEKEVGAEAEKKPVSEEDKKTMIEEKMKSLTPEQKKALIEAKLKSMTPEQKKALIEAKKKKLEEQKNGDN